MRRAPTTIARALGRVKLSDEYGSIAGAAVDDEEQAKRWDWLRRFKIHVLGPVALGVAVVDWISKAIVALTQPLVNPDIAFVSIPSGLSVLHTVHAARIGWIPGGEDQVVTAVVGLLAAGCVLLFHASVWSLFFGILTVVLYNVVYTYWWKKY